MKKKEEKHSGGKKEEEKSNEEKSKHPNKRKTKSKIEKTSKITNSSRNESDNAVQDEINPERNALIEETASEDIGKTRRRKKRRRSHSRDNRKNFHLNPTESDIESQNQIKTADYEIIPVPASTKSYSSNGSEKSKKEKKKTCPDSSESTIFAESETSEEYEAKTAKHSQTSHLFSRILRIDFFYFFFTSLIIILLTFVIHKDFSWDFYHVKDSSTDPVTYDKKSVNCRNIGFFIAFSVFITGILSVAISAILQLIESYFDLTMEWLAILSSLNIHLAFLFILVGLLILLLYKGMISYQFAMDTQLDFGHVVNTMLLTTVFLTIKSFFLKRVALSFDHARYMKRVRGILRDYFLTQFLKAIKKLRLKENKAEKDSKDAGSSYISIESENSDKKPKTDGENRSETSKKSKEKKQSTSKKNLQDAHDHCLPWMATHSDFATDMAKKFLHQDLFDYLFFSKIYEDTVKIPRKNLAYMKKAFYKLSPRDVTRTATKMKWKEKAESIKGGISIETIGDLSNFFCCEKFFLLWLDSIKLANLVKLVDSGRGNIDESSSEPEAFDELFMSEGHNTTATDDISNLNTDSEVENPKWTENREEQKKVTQIKSIVKKPFSALLISKLFERRDRELFNLKTSLEQNNAAVDRVSNFLTVLIFLLALSIFLGISLNKTDKTVDILSALFGTGFILNSTIKDAISSCVFVFCIQPFDVGDRVMIHLEDSMENLVVSELNVLSTTFIKFDGMYVIVPNTTLSTKSIMNIRRSPLLAESFYINVRYDTPVESLEILKYNISQFLRANPSLFTEFFYFNYHVIEDCNKLTLRIYIQYVENWQEYERYLERRGLFLSFVNKCLNELGIAYKPLVQPIQILKSSKI